MCVLFVAFRKRQGMPLVVAANRDEFYDRPTASLGFWEDAPAILAGRDLRSGGTWLGASRTGRWAALTNVRGTHDTPEAAPSRGELPVRFLRSDEPPERFLRRVAREAPQFAPFNLLVGTLDELGFYSSVEGSLQMLKPGLYGLSNQALNSPWPKVTRGAELFRQIIEDPDELKTESLFLAMRDEAPAPDHLLPDTGVGVELERLLSPIFISGHKYGTRSSSVLTIDGNEFYFRERRFAEHGVSSGSSAHEIPLRAKA